MKEIKTRDTVKDVRMLDRQANVANRVKNTYICTKEQSEQTKRVDADSPTSYAEDRTTESAQDMNREVGYILRHRGKNLVEKTRQKIKERHSWENAAEQKQPTVQDEPQKVHLQKVASSKTSTFSQESHVSKSNDPDYSTPGRDFARSHAHQRTESKVTDYAGKESRQGIKTVKRGMKQSVRVSGTTVKTSARGPIKTAEHSIKTAKEASRTAIKTTQASTKTAVKTAQTTARAAQRAAQAAKATAKATVSAAKTIAKAITSTVKLIIATVKELATAIAAGGWIAVVVIVVVLLAAYILCSVFGIFVAEEGYNGSPAMPVVVNQINADFSAKIDSIIETNPHDRLVIDNAGSASMVANWNEVLAIYDILVATDPENPMEVATLDNAKIDKLKKVFWDMNRLSYSLDEVQVGTDEETEEPITETVLTISVSCKSAEDMILYYGLRADRAAQVRELLQPVYSELFMRLTGSYVDITLSATEIAAIMETLPDDLSEARRDAVLTAYSLLDKVKYFWGGKSLVFGWDSRWGVPMTVTANGSPTTDKVRPFGLDCSGFVDWVFYNASGGEYIMGHGGGAIAQYSYCDAIPWSSAQPGDLAFYPGCEHVGIVVKNDAGTLTINHCASGDNNVVMTQHTRGNGFVFIGRPQIYGEYEQPPRIVAGIRRLSR